MAPSMYVCRKVKNSLPVQQERKKKKRNRAEWRAKSSSVILLNINRACAHAIH